MGQFIVLVGSVSQYQLKTAHYLVVCMQKQHYSIYVQIDIVQYCQYDFVTDQVTNKRCPAQFSIDVD